jgi:CubicO group peptidase (beta-lactamase class C family)
MIARRTMMTGLGVTFGAALMTTTARADSSWEQRLAELEKSGRVFGLDALIVSRGGKTIFEHYGEGQAEAWGTPLGVVKFGPTVIHDLRSVSKSVVSWIYGIALAQGKVPTPETRLSAAFPQYADLQQQPGRAELTVGHVLSMTVDMDWDELTIPYGDLRNSENAMEAAPDRYRYVLERPILGPPGVKWTYNGGCTTLLARLIADGTGEKLHAYARRVLFEPLGFGANEWVLSKDGNEIAASGLRLLPRDMVKIGQLVLNGGAWDGKQVVPADWVKRATTPVVHMPDGRGYGYHWYTGAFQDATHPPLPWIAGIGWGGQRLYVIPKGDLVVGINCGNYRRSGRDQHMVGVTLVTELVLPALA